MPAAPRRRCPGVAAHAALVGTLAVATAVALPAQEAAADSSARPPVRTALALGWSPAAGAIGAEWVHRAAPGRRLGWAAGVGFAGFGARLNLELARRGRAGARQRVPYVGVGALATPWMPVLDTRGAASLEGGVQFWPVARGGWYADLGAGAAAVFSGDGTQPGPVLRLLVGRAR
jgi:hypothetical protein